MNYWQHLIRPNSIQEIHSRICQLTSFFFLSGILLSWKLWFGNRIFPYVPFFQLDQYSCRTISLISSILLTIFLIWNLIKPSIFNTVSILVSVSVCALVDQSKIQPWVYFYFLLFISYILPIRKNDKAAAYGIILIVMYFFSGLWKLNTHYFQSIPYQEKTFIPGSVATFILYATPVIEILISGFLILSKSRKIIVLFSLIFHGFILFFLISRGDNWVVVPWNMAIPWLNYLLFYEKSSINFLAFFKKVKTNYASIFFVVYVCFSPLLYLTKHFDRYLSWGLYTEDNADLWITLAPDQYAAFADILTYELEVTDLSTARVVSMNDFAMKELGVPLVSEHRIFSFLTDYYCKQSSNTNALVFSTYERPFELGQYQSWTCGSPIPVQK